MNRRAGRLASTGDLSAGFAKDVAISLYSRTPRPRASSVLGARADPIVPTNTENEIAVPTACLLPNPTTSVSLMAKPKTPGKGSFPARYGPIACLVALIALAGVSTWTATRARIDRSRTYTIDYGNDVPFHYKGNDGKPTGLAVEMVQEAARAQGIKLDWVEARKGSGVHSQLRVLLSVRTNLPKNIHITEPYLQGRSSFIVPRESSLRSVADLEGRRISYPDYAIHRVNLARLLKAFTPVPVTSSREAMEKVNAGEADAALMNDYAVQPACLETAVPVPIRILPTLAPVNRMCIGSDPEFAGVADLLREEIREMAVDARLERIVDRWGFFPNLATDRRDELLRERRKVFILQLASGALLLLIGLSSWLIHRLRAERRLAVEAERTQTGILDALPASIALLDRTGVVKAANRSWPNLPPPDGRFGATCDLGRNYLDYCLSVTDDGSGTARRIAEGIQAVLQGTAPGFTLEYPTRGHSGQRWFRLMVSPVNDAGQTGVVIAHLDQTERKREESERLNLESQLRQAQKMEAIGALAGGIAHDFNNVLGAITCNAYLATLDLPPRAPAHESLAAIQRSAARASSLVRQILAFSRKEPQQRQPIDFRPVVTEAIELVRVTLPAGVELTADYGNPPIALADSTDIHQVVINLVTNAWHAMDGRPGSIRVALVGVDLTEAQVGGAPELPSGTYVKLTVSDSGHGMSAETLANAFEPFFTTKAPGKGTGLGLAVVQRIVKNHQGAIRVKSAVGQGTTFELLFPAQPGSNDAPIECGMELPAIHGSSRRILFVDDEELLVEAGAKLLEWSGFRVTGFSCPETGMRTFRANPEEFAMIVTDYHMPGCNGLEFAQQARRIRPTIPILLVSGFITDQLRAEAGLAGINEVRSKPLGPPDLLRAVDALAASDSVTSASRPARSAG